jgi:hypothetical protein
MGLVSKHIVKNCNRMGVSNTGYIIKNDSGMKTSP